MSPFRTQAIRPPPRLSEGRDRRWVPVLPRQRAQSEENGLRAARAPRAEEDLVPPSSAGRRDAGFRRWSELSLLCYNRTGKLGMAVETREPAGPGEAASRTTLLHGRTRHMGCSLPYCPVFNSSNKKQNKINPCYSNKGLFFLTTPSLKDQRLKVFMPHDSTSKQNCLSSTASAPRASPLAESSVYRKQRALPKYRRFSANYVK